MAHRAPEVPGCRAAVVGAVRIVACLALLVGVAAAKCSDVGPAQKPPPPRVDIPSSRIPSWRPAYPGDSCGPPGATWHSSTGETLTCGRHRGLGYDTWG